MAHPPYMDEGLRRWIISYANRNKWRVPTYVDIDDLIQDGYLCYTKVWRTYYGLGKRRNPTKNNRRVFMSLVKTSFVNHMTDLSNERREKRETAVSSLTVSRRKGGRSEYSYDEVLEYIGGVEHANPEIIAVLSAPSELGKLFKALHSDASEYVAFIKIQVGDHWRRETNAEYVARRAGFSLRGRKLGETMNKFLCRRLEFDPKTVDIVSILSKHYGVDVAG